MTNTLTTLPPLPIPPWALFPNMPNPYFEGGRCVKGAVEYSVLSLAQAARGKPVIAVNMSKLLPELNTSAWLHDCVPMKVITAMQSGKVEDKYVEHIDRILFADVVHPIIIDSHYMILDGYHRLAHQYIAGAVTINCVMLHRDDLKPLRKYQSL